MTEKDKVLDFLREGQPHDVMTYHIADGWWRVCLDREIKPVGISIITHEENIEGIKLEDGVSHDVHVRDVDEVKEDIINIMLTFE